MRNVVFPAVDDSAVIHPRSEHGANRPIQLLPRIGGEVFSGAFANELLEADYELLEIVRCEFRVVDIGVVPLLFEVMNYDLEGFVIFVGPLLHAHDHIAIHLNESPIAVPGKTFVLGCRGEGEDSVIVQSEVENRIHHAGHGLTRAGADGHQQWHIFRIAEFRAHDFLDVRNTRLDQGLKLLWICLFMIVIVRANFGRDGEAWRHR